MTKRDAAISRERRTLLRLAATGGVTLVGCATTAAQKKPESGSAEAEVTPGEDLMQEHGALERILLVYEEAARRIEAKSDLDPKVVVGAATLIRRFVEEYHERQEEESVFPRLQAAHREVELVSILLRQHQRGRDLTAVIIKATSASLPDLVAPLRAFIRMYRPHAAREDTVLFPAFREVVGGGAYRELGEQFEDKEHALFGEGGFERNVAEIAHWEAALGIDDLARFTP